MSQEQNNKKNRVRRSPEMIAELVLEAERSGKAAEICRRENITPALFSRWRARAKEGMILSLTQMKRRGRKKVDQEKVASQKEIHRLKAALCESAIELQLLKKSVSSGYMDP